MLNKVTSWGPNFLSPLLPFTYLTLPLFCCLLTPLLWISSMVSHSKLFFLLWTDTCRRGNDDINHQRHLRGTRCTCWPMYACIFKIYVSVYHFQHHETVASTQDWWAISLSYCQQEAPLIKWDYNVLHHAESFSRCSNPQRLTQEENFQATAQKRPQCDSKYCSLNPTLAYQHPAACLFILFSLKHKHWLIFTKIDCFNPSNHIFFQIYFG